MKWFKWRVIQLQGVQKKMCRSFCLISPATSILEHSDIFHLKGDIHSFVLSTSSFLCNIGEPRYEENKMVYHISRIRNTVILQCLQKHVIHKKVFRPKNVLCNLLFQLFEMVFCELVLLELGDLLGLSLLRNFFSVARLIFSCKYFSMIGQYFQFF